MDSIQLISTGARVFRSLGQLAEFFEAALDEFSSILGDEPSSWSLTTSQAPNPKFEPLAGTTIEEVLVDHYRLLAAHGHSARFDIQGEQRFEVAGDTLNKSGSARLTARNQASNDHLTLTSSFNEPLILGWRFGHAVEVQSEHGRLAQNFRDLVEVFRPERARLCQGGGKLRLEVASKARGRQRAAPPILDYAAWVRDQPPLENAPPIFSQESFAGGLWLSLVDDDGEPIFDETLNGRALDASVHLARRARPGQNLLEHLGLSLGNVDPAGYSPDGHIPGHRFNGERKNGDLVTLFGQPSPFEKRPQFHFDELVRQEARRQIKWSGDRNIVWLATSEEAVNEVDDYLSGSEFDPIRCEYTPVPPLLDPN